MAAEEVPPVDVPKQLQVVIQQIADTRKFMWFQVEDAGLRFRTRLTVRQDKVLVAAPRWARDQMTAESWLRLEVPTAAGEDSIRLRVLKPDANPGSDPAVCICAMPEAMVRNHRAAHRFAVPSDADLNVVINGRPYPVADLSQTGLRVRPSLSQKPDEIPLGVPVAKAHLALGAEVWVQFGKLTPRSRRGRLIGCHFHVSTDGKSPHNLTSLIDSLRHRAVVTLPDVLATPGAGGSPQTMAGG